MTYPTSNRLPQPEGDTQDDGRPPPPPDLDEPEDDEEAEG